MEDYLSKREAAFDAKTRFSYDFSKESEAAFEEAYDLFVRSKINHFGQEYVRNFRAEKLRKFDLMDDPMQEHVASIELNVLSKLLHLNDGDGDLMFV